MAKAKTPSFILELGLETDAHEEAELNKRFEAARQLYNACLSEAKRRLELLHQSKEFQEARKIPKTVNGKANMEGVSQASHALEFSTKTTKLSQYCHKCGKYTKKPLSQRVHTCCNLNIQRDLYSAFLAGSVVENKAEGSAYCLDTADVINNPLPPLVRGTLAEYGSCSPAGGIPSFPSCEWKATAFQLWSPD